MSHYIVCAHCGKTYNTHDSWQAGDHENEACTAVQHGFCDTCGGNGALHIAETGEAVHTDQTECIRFLTEQVKYMEQYRLEHDTRYCELEKAVEGLVNGRKAALAESRTLKAIRNSDAAVSR
ncbi:hypothetical protein LCGC14_0499310 [marine sediment metagenome]|uniref:Uncharacterized protein n=1 Tax=marine sediment metagenome TaxID=412755 RepID=A0A0F9URC2_9ZZZZ